MRKYELVVVCNARVWEEERNKTLQEVEKHFSNNLIKKDDIWIKDAAYALHWKKDRTKMYLVSYYLELEPAQVAEIKKWMTYIQWIERYFFYSMKQDQQFFTYDELQKKVEDMFSTETE